MKMAEFIEMDKLTYLIREGTTAIFIKQYFGDLMDFLLEMDNDKVMISGFTD